MHCISNGVYELEGRGPVESFEFGDELPGGVVAHEVDAICPDETALYIPSHRALACADGVVRAAGGRARVRPRLPDGRARADQARATRRHTGGLLDLDFDVLLLAHGEPLAGGAKDALAQFAGAA